MKYRYLPLSFFLCFLSVPLSAKVDAQPLKGQQRRQQKVNSPKSKKLPPASSEQIASKPRPEANEPVKISYAPVGDVGNPGRISGSITIEGLRRTVNDPNRVFTVPELPSVRVPGIDGFEIKNAFIHGIKKLSEDFYIVRIRLGGNIIIGGIDQSTLSSWNLEESNVLFFADGVVGNEIATIVYPRYEGGHICIELIADIYEVKQGERKFRALRIIYGLGGDGWRIGKFPNSSDKRLENN